MEEKKAQFFIFLLHKLCGETLLLYRYKYTEYIQFVSMHP